MHKVFIRTYQKTPIVQYYTHKIIKTNVYRYNVHTHKMKKYTLQLSTPNSCHHLIIDSINTSLLNATMSLLSAISHD